MRHRQTAVKFPNRDGHQLFGILHEPLDGAREDIAVILLSPGVKSRVAPHRMYNKTADMLVELGFRTFRFDFYGLGDSEGRIGEPLLADLYGSIQVGRYVSDTQCAIRWIRETFGTRRVILAGLCGGAITGLLAAPATPDVAGLLCLGIPVNLDGANVDKVRFMTAGQLQSVRRRYLRKVANPSAWIRLLTGRSDYRLLVRSLAKGRGPGRSKPEEKPASGVQPPQDPTNLNPYFAAAFEQTLARSGSILLLFSGSDRLYWEFEEKFLARHPDIMERYADRVRLDVIPQANHVLTFTEWQEQMLEKSRAWLLDTFGRPSVAGHAHLTPPVAATSARRV